MAARRSGPRQGASGIGVVLDAGAFIALERRSGHAAQLVARLIRAGAALVTSGGVVAQVWRGGAGAQAPVAMLLARTEVVPLDATEGKVVGMLLAASGARDAVDAHVVLLARERGLPVLTSDDADLLAIDPSLVVVHV